jgi:hypothetical protein
MVYWSCLFWLVAPRRVDLEILEVVKLQREEQLSPQTVALGQRAELAQLKIEPLFELAQEVGLRPFVSLDWVRLLQYLVE